MKVHVSRIAGLMLIGLLLIFASDCLHATDRDSIATPDNQLLRITGHEMQQPVAKKSTQEQVQEYLVAARTARKKGDPKQALIYYQKVIGIWPTNVDAWVELGNLWYEKTDYKEALHCYRKALEFKPDMPVLHHNIELCIKKQGNVDDTQGYYEQMIRLYPQDAKNYLTYSKLLRKKKKTTEALSILTKALNVMPDDPAIYREIGIFYREQSLFDKAIEFFRKAAELSPDNTTMLLELANTCCIIDEYDEALLYYNKAFEIDPSLNNALYNIGYTIKRQGHIDAAIEVLEKVVERDPAFAQAHFGLGIGYLARARDDDDWIRGWLEYEWRWQLHKELHKQYYNKPFWNGSDLAGKTILVICEQGYGDTFQFIRYAKLLKNMGARVICLSQHTLKQYLSTACDYLDGVVIASDPLPDFDVQVYLMSIPHILETTEKIIPADIPYLSADSELISYWNERLAKDGIRIGICWQGNSNYSTDALKRVVAAKSLLVNKLAPLAAIPRCHFYSLQKITGTQQLEDLNDLIIHDFGHDLDEEHGRFMDTAAIIKNLDLVITVDTSISHLAAGLGVETWILLPTPSDWRWMYKRTDTPWYPNVRLFRQPTLGDWEGVVSAVVEALTNFINHSEDHSCEIPKKKIMQESKNQFHKDNDRLSKEDFLFALSPDEFIDQFTLLAIQRGSTLALNTGAVEGQDKLIEQYHAYVGKHEQMPILSQGLYAVNCYLTVIMNGINEGDYDVNSARGQEKIAQLNRALKLKRLMKEEIKRLID